MRKVYFFIILIFFQVGAFAQTKEQEEYRVQYKSGNYLPKKHYQLEDSAKKGSKGARSAASQQYVLIQFYKLPDKAIHQKVKAAGIELLEYIPNNAYLASVNSTVDADMLASLQVRSLEPIKSEHKINPALSRPDLSDLKGKRELDVIVTAFKRYSTSLLTNEIEAIGGNVLKEYSGSNMLEVRIQKGLIPRLALLKGVSYIAPVAPSPVPLNYNAVVTSRVNVLRSGISSNRNLKGEGVAVAVGDIFTGDVHADLQNRFSNQTTFKSDDPHGDHTSGIIGGAGNLNPLHAGIAPKAALIFTDMVDNIDNASTYYNKQKMRISSNSYRGSLNGGEYDFNSKIVDMQASGGDYPDLLHVFAAANEGPSFRTVADSWSAAKNALVVGALDNTNQIAYYSSRGPVKDGRIKPEVVVVGTNISSTYPGNTYSSHSGTSMATPAVAGIASLLYERYKQLYNNANPDAGLIKALICNTANDLGNPGPDFTHGFGQVNARKAVEVLEKGNWWKGTVNAGDSITHTINIPSGAASLKVMLYWKDKEAADNSAVALVNDLDLRVKKDGEVYLPWVLDPSAGKENKTAVRAVDRLNNIEQVTIDNPSGSWSFTVNGKRLATKSQEYVVVYEVVEPEIVVTYPYAGESLVPGESVMIRWDHAVQGPFSVDFSADNGASWKSIATNIAEKQNYVEWTIPGIVTGKLLVRVSNGTKSGQSAGFSSVLEVPKGVIVGDIGSGKRQIRWKKVAGATEYDVYQLSPADKEMKLLTSIADTSFLVENISSNAYWFSVRARNQQGAVSRRAIATKAVIFRKPDAPASVEAGLEYAYYEGNWDAMPDFSSLKAVKTGTAKSISPDAIKQKKDNYGIRYTGFIKVKEDGLYTFLLFARTEARFYIGDKLVGKHAIDRDGDDFGEGSIALQAGVHKITFDFYNRNASNKGEFAYLLISGDGFQRREVEASELFRKGENVPPVVNLSAPAADAGFEAPATISITATASDPDGTVSKVEFFNGGTKLGEVMTAPYTYKWANVAAGSYTIMAKATDNEGAVASSAQVNIRVEEAPKENKLPVVSISSPAADAPFVAPATISITAAASDPDGKINKVEFFNGNTKLGEIATAPYTYSWSNVSPGSYSIIAKATDDKGAVANSAAVVVKVAEAKKENKAPVVSLSSPAADAGFQAPATISITATASDPDGGVSKVEFFNGYTKLGEVSTAPYTYSWSNVGAGSYSLLAKATDDKGAVTSSSPIIIKVEEAKKENQLPLVSAGDDNTIELPVNSFSLNGKANDNDGRIVAFRWSKVSGPSVAIIGQNSANASLKNLTEGVYVFRFSATDNDGATVSDDITLTVLPEPVPNQLPVISLNPEMEVTLPVASLTISAGAFDADGSVESYKWEKISGPAVEINNEHTATLALTGLVEGNYLFRLTVTDNEGARASGQLSLKVLKAPVVENQIPVANAGADKTLYLPSNSVILSGQAIDSNGRFTSFLWEKVSGPSVSMSGQNTANVKLTDLEEGVYVFRFSATDNDGATGSDETILTVKPSSRITPLSEDNGSVKVYPNTFQDYINLEFQADEFSLYEIRVFDLLGRSWYHSQITVEPKENGQVHTIDFSAQNITEGMYIMQIDNRSQNTRKVCRIVKAY